MRSADYVDAIESARKANGLSMAEAARHVGMTRQFWWDVVNGVRATPTVDTISRMAKGAGIALELRAPVLDAAHESATGPGKAVSPFVARLLAKIRGRREAYGITQAQAAQAAGMTRGAYTNLENGRSAYSISVDRLHGMASSFGLTVDLVAEHHRPLLELDVDEAEAVAQLLGWYHQQTRGRMPVASLSALNKLRPRRTALDTAA